MCSDFNKLFFNSCIKYIYNQIAMPISNYTVYIYVYIYIYIHIHTVDRIYAQINYTVYTAQPFTK